MYFKTITYVNALFVIEISNSIIQIGIEIDIEIEMRLSSKVKSGTLGFYSMAQNII